MKDRVGSLTAGQSSGERRNYLLLPKPQLHSQSSYTILEACDNFSEETIYKA